MRASHRVPPEIRRMIIETAANNGCNLGNIASVSREWQAIVEPRNFQRLKVTQERVWQLNEMTQRHRHHVRYIWFCIELKTYQHTGGMAQVAHCPSVSIVEYYDVIFCYMEEMFSALSAWGSASSDGLTLDISVYSPGDKGYWFQYLTFEPDLDFVPAQDTTYSPYIPGPEYSMAPNGGLFHSRYQIWRICRRVPPRHALEKVFQRINNSWLSLGGPMEDELDPNNDLWSQLSPAPVVTRLMLRQQTRRRWQPDHIVAFLGSLPGLQEFHYEPWREFSREEQWQTDQLYSVLLESEVLGKLKRLTIFENFDRLYPFGFHSCGCHRTRVINESLSKDLVPLSFELETLSGAFMFEARKFFSHAVRKELYRHRIWPELRSLHLTSKLLQPMTSKDRCMRMLADAAKVAIRMPQLATLEIWNGDMDLAVSFKFEFFQSDHTARVTWTSPWGLDPPFNADIIKAWEKVAAERGSNGGKVEWVTRVVDDTAKCHGDAILQLGLSGTVIRPVSVKQIREKNNYPPVDWSLERAQDEE